jgi:hypothetical protein
MNDALLKIYASKYSGDPVSIVANRKGLNQLRNLLNDALGYPGNYSGNDFSQGNEDFFTVQCRHMSDDEVEVFWDDFPAQEDEFSEMSAEELALIMQFDKDK